MARHLPPFAAVRAFEVAARRLSFRRAAHELNLTESAISHQVKRLEEHLGVQLFRRLSRGLQLTTDGRMYLSPVRDALDQLAEATVRIRAGRSEGTFTVSLMASFAVHWLVPRLQSFQEAHPEIDIRLVTSCALANFAEDGVEAAIRYGRGQWPGLRSDFLISEYFFPVCSPRLVEHGPPLANPADLVNHTLLQNLDEPDAWRMWLHAAGVDTIKHYEGPTFDTLPLIMRAAIAGMGVAIGYRPLVDEELEAGRLIAPFDKTYTSGLAYFFVCPEATASQPKMVAFRDWLMNEISDAQANHEGERWIGVPCCGVPKSAIDVDGSSI